MGSGRAEGEEAGEPPKRANRRTAVNGQERLNPIMFLVSKSIKVFLVTFSLN